MKNKRKSSVLAAVLTLALLLTACGTFAPVGDTSDTTAESETGKIYLYGELHSVEAILDQELERWQAYYHEENMRHLFMELPYYTAEFLNLYMQAEGEEILDAIHEDSVGTSAYTPEVKEFYRQIKETCPETIFHGTDVGHQYNTTGQRFLEYLEDNGLQETEQYALTQQAIEQGRTFYEQRDHAYRENQMVENFIRTFESLQGESIMGIYGSNHIELNAKLDLNTDRMADQLYECYGDVWIISDLQRVSTSGRKLVIKVGDKSYQVAYFGRQDFSKSETTSSYRDFRRLEDAYSDLKDLPTTGEVLPCSDYPMKVEAGQVFAVDYIQKDGTVQRKFYRADGTEQKGHPVTVEIIVE